MIDITTVRRGFIVTAYTVNDRNDVFVAVGYTRKQAKRRLVKTMDRGIPVNN